MYLMIQVYSHVIIVIIKIQARIMIIVVICCYRSLRLRCDQALLTLCLHKRHRYVTVSPYIGPQVESN